MAHSVKEYVRRISSQDLELYPDWDLKKPLPRLPVPSLTNTMDHYLKLVKPIVSPDEYNHTVEIVQQFSEPGGVGEKLQEKLVEIASKQDNWVNQWWLDDMYLKNPLALPINSSPGMVFPRQHFLTEREHLRFAAQLVAGIFDYKTVLDTRGLPVERATHHKKGQPLCMEQYYRLFSSYRYPGAKADTLITNLSRDPFDPEYIVVACRDQFFTLEVVSEGTRLRDEEIYNQLRRITRLAEEGHHSAARVGILTALPRPTWFAAREYLCEDPINQTSLKTIENCCFILCLDKSVPSLKDQNSSSPNADDILALEMLHGLGSKNNAANRWYDKTMQFVVSADGNCGLNYEHSVAEGIAVITLVEHILKYMDEMKPKRLVRCSSTCELAAPNKLQWHVDSKTKANIKHALKELDELANNLDIHILRYMKYGRNFPKTVDMSPDSYIQLALQLAHYKIHHFLVPTYESASLRRFYLGRVDNIRAASMPALNWCKAMVNKDQQYSDAEKIRFLRLAMEWQTTIMLQNILGQGVDNHLLGLRETGMLLNMEVPELFKDKTYKEANCFRLSTSQVPTTMDTFITYGAVVPNGYGAAYNPHPNYIVVAISCWRNCPEIRADVFAKALEEAFDEMHHLLSSNPSIVDSYNKRKIVEEPTTTIKDDKKEPINGEK